MVEPPSFLNINDFIGTFLPGYVAVTLYLALFHYDLLFGEEALSFDLFSAVVFIIAGPTIGATVRQFHRSLQQSIVRVIVRHFSKGNGSRVETEFDTYAIARLKTSDTPLNELEKTEATMDFCVSTTIVLLVLGIGNLIATMTFTPFIHVSIFILSAILFMGAILEYRLSFVPTVSNLIRLQDKLGSSDTKVNSTANTTRVPPASTNRIKSYKSDGTPIYE
jgi:hypothetical protein